MKKHLILSTLLSLTLLTATPLLARSLARPVEELFPLHQAVIDNDIALVKTLLSNKADVNQKSQLRYWGQDSIILDKTPLHFVNSAEIAKLLIEKGADVNAQDSYGWMPLHYAKDVNIARLLIEKGADINARGKWYISTPLCTHINSDEIVRLLIEKKADVNAECIYGHTPLHATSNASIAHLLLENGANVNAKDHDGDTPLHWEKDINIAHLLIENGADVNAKNDEGKTALHKMPYYKKFIIAILLIKNSNNINPNHSKKPTLFQNLHALILPQQKPLAVQIIEKISKKSFYYDDNFTGGINGAASKEYISRFLKKFVQQNSNQN